MNTRRLTGIAASSLWFIVAAAACSSPTNVGDGGDVTAHDGDAAHAETGGDVVDARADAPIDAPADVVVDTGNDTGPVDAGCTAPLVNCGGTCTDVQSDNANCGTCGTACTSGMMCSGGMCMMPCATGLTACGGMCVNAQTDMNNCGACGRACTTGQACVAGICTVVCPTGMTACSGTCVDLQSDSMNCGACGTACSVTGQSCMAGTCSCGAGSAVCGGACVNEQTDSNNCGSCGHVCSVTGQTCMAGTCACAAGQMACGSACVNTQTDSNNCGTCGHVCSATGQTCVAGTCTCPTGQMACGSACVNTQTDSNNCGTCGTVCPSGQVCSAGMCRISCATGLTNCSGSCVNLQTDTANCGTCGMACATGATCASGTCSCPTGDMVCSGACVNTQTDINNCGTCGTRCTATGQTCTAGSCACPSGQSVCGTACVNLQTDPNNCGMCGHMCATGIACSAGSCGTVCGNGVREGTEQCDDGNTRNLDGCDALCRFEQDHRIVGLAIQHGTSTLCTRNALGGAISTLALPTLNGDLSTSIQNGTLNMLMTMLNPVPDLTGTTDPSVTLGVLGGMLAVPYATGVNGQNDLDWWYTADATALDASRRPTAILMGSIAAHVLNAGPGSFSLPVNLGGTMTSTLQLSNAIIRVTLASTATAPTESTTGMPPGHTASEHLDTTITTFPTGGGTPTMPTGQMCGNVSALSLSQIPVPAALAMGGSNACSQNYSPNLANNSLLDVFVHGCTFIITAVSPTQPDQPGGYTLRVTGNHVTSCVMGTTTVPLATCLAAVSYSSYLTFATDRVIIH